MLILIMRAGFSPSPEPEKTEVKGSSPGPCLCGRAETSQEVIASAAEGVCGESCGPGLQPRWVAAGGVENQQRLLCRESSRTKL
jgi:hypothetical protein